MEITTVGGRWAARGRRGVGLYREVVKATQDVYQKGTTAEEAGRGGGRAA